MIEVKHTAYLLSCSDLSFSTLEIFYHREFYRLFSDNIGQEFIRFNIRPFLYQKQGLLLVFFHSIINNQQIHVLPKKPRNILCQNDSQQLYQQQYLYQMISITTILLISFAILNLWAKTPPTYNFSYYASFDETNVINNVNYTIKAQQFYDPINNKERIDYVNGRYDRICGTIIPNASTPCQHLTTANRRWIVFPDKYQCCFCCDSAHGCGILKPNWLEQAEYLGEESIGGSAFDKWSKAGSGYNYIWVTQDAANTPKKLDEGGKHIKDYQTEYFSPQQFPESVFALPSYCDIAKNCPLQSRCGVFRGDILDE